MNKRFSVRKMVFPMLITAIAVVALICCTGRGPKEPLETPTQGNIKIVSDESFQPIIDSQVAVFTSLYDAAHISPEYKPETDLVSDFLNDSVKVVITSWKPSEDQKKILLGSLIEVHTVKIAYDALALIINKNNNDSLLTYSTVSDIFQGKITNWKQINPKSKLSDISIIFDNEKSGNIRYFKEKFNISGSLPGNFYAVKSNPEVIDYVNKTPNSLGIISVNWISDHDDSLALSFIKKIRPVAISAAYLDDSQYYYPQQGYIYNKSYPFIREINMVSRETFNGLGSGFTAFVSSAQGQRIILKSGLVPATMPVRIIQQKH
jgi:phosphate transport system substrate-binding protein